MFKLKKSFWAKRFLALVAATILTSGAIFPLIVSNVSATSGLLTARSVEMSTSQVSASDIYQIGFTIATTGVVQGIDVDFCSGTTSPIIGETCTKPTGFSLGTYQVATSGGANTGLTGTWVPASIQSGQTLELSDATGGSLTSGASIIFTLGGTGTAPTNTSTLGTFYVRILTFATPTLAAAYTSGTPGTYIDGGGVALSTANQLTITAKVQEQLTFCIDTNGATSCGSASGTTVLLGDAQDVLSTTFPAVSNAAEYIVQTNAGSGAAIRMSGCTLYIGGNCSGISIASTTTGATSSPGSSQFGMCSYGVTGYTTNLSITTAYNQGGNCSTITPDAGGTLTSGAAGSATFAFQAATTGTFGDQIGTESAGSQGIAYLAFLGNASASQQEGTYATTLTFIATGTF